MPVSRADFQQVADYRMAKREEQHESAKKTWNETFGPIGRRVTCLLVSPFSVLGVGLQAVGNVLNTGKTALKTVGSAFLWLVTKRGSDIHMQSKTWTKRYACKTALKAGRIFSNLGVGVVNTLTCVGGIIAPKIAEKGNAIKYAHDMKYYQLQSRIEHKYSAPALLN